MLYKTIYLGMVAKGWGFDGPDMEEILYLILLSTAM